MLKVFKMVNGLFVKMFENEDIADVSGIEETTKGEIKNSRDNSKPA